MRSNAICIWLVVLVSTCVADRAAGVVQAEPTFFNDSLKPFLASNCFSCHGAEKQSGELNLQTLVTTNTLESNRATWENVLKRIEKGEMPPARQPRPEATQLKSAIAGLHTEFDRLDALHGSPIKLTPRRLNRTEYNNSVRDLLGIDVRPADDFPADDSGYGFDNIGDVLSMSPMLMEKYLKAAERVARTAVYGVPKLKSTAVTHQPWYIDFNMNRQFPKEYDETGMSMPYSSHAIHRVPVDGEYEITGWVRGFRPAGSDPIRVGFWIDGKLVHEGAVPVLHFEGELNGLSTSFKTHMTAGDHWLSVTIIKIYEGLPKAYNGPNPSQSDARARKAPHEFFAQNIRVVGPLSQKMGPTPESLQKIYTCGHTDGTHGADCAKKIVTDLATRAFRRPATDDEVGGLINLVEMVRRDGDSFEESLVVAIEKILLSPHFIFRLEKDPASLTAYEVATRLSYFLWSTAPDDELRARAGDGTITQPAVLEAQVKRMLKDPRSAQLVENFGGQWLQFRALESHTVERKKFQQFTDYTRMSMQKETELFLANMVAEDRSVLELIDSDYTFLNQRLAEFYGIADVKGHEWRKVQLAPDSPRGGVMTMASVLTVSSYATRTSPVIRGKYVLENILNAPPPAPPADVPGLAEESVGTAASMRQMLEKHRENATCASCHSRMDPLGFGLENFDAIGQWRVKEGNFDIDSSAELPDGQKFNGAKEMKAVLLKEKEAFAACLADKMMTYALGRGIKRADEKTIQAIAKQMADSEYRFSSLVLGVVNSPQFRGGMGFQPMVDAVPAPNARVSN